MRNIYIIVIFIIITYSFMGCNLEPDPQDVISYTLNNQYFEYNKGYAETNNLPFGIWLSNDNYTQVFAFDKIKNMPDNPEFGAKIILPGNSSGSTAGVFQYITTMSGESLTTMAVPIDVTIKVEEFGNIGGYIKGTFSGSSDSDEVVNGYFNVMRFSEDILP